jgi:hypothetical protein
MQAEALANRRVTKIIKIMVTIQVICKNFVWKKVIIQGLEKILASFERSEGGWLNASRTE